LGNAGLVAGVKPSTITHIRDTYFNPIVFDDEETPILGRQFQDYHHFSDPSVLAAPANEDILSVFISQKDIFPVLDSILGIIGRKETPVPLPYLFLRRMTYPSHRPSKDENSIIFQRVPVPIGTAFQEDDLS
jgi:hypothetical protein